VTLPGRIEVEIASGKTASQTCEEIEITVQTLRFSRKALGRRKLDQAKRRKEPEKRNGQANRLLVHWPSEKRGLNDQVATLALLFLFPEAVTKMTEWSNGRQHVYNTPNRAIGRREAGTLPEVQRIQFDMADNIQPGEIRDLRRLMPVDDCHNQFGTNSQMARHTLITNQVKRS
jgi:hypothetical protein